MPRRHDAPQRRDVTRDDTDDIPGSSDEVALIQEAKRDIAAFGPLYARYVDRIYSYVRTRIGRAHVDDAADLTQQVFLQALDALPRYQVRGNSSFAAWLFRVAHNVATDWQRRRHSTIPWEAVSEELHPTAADTADGVALQREEMLELHHLLATLSEDARELLLLRFTAQLTLAEIGVVLGITAEATRKRITRTLHTLQEHYHANTTDAF